MNDPAVNLHRIDLEQVELYQKLHARLGRELRAIQKLTHLIALRESSLDAESLQLAPPPTDPEEDMDTATLKHAEAIDALQRQTVQMIKLAKSGIWQASDKLRKTHVEQREERSRDVVVETEEVE